MIDRAAAGDPAAWQDLVRAHRERLRRMVALRLDPRLRGRVDPSDIVQEAFLAATGLLADYQRDPPLPFYLWLRQLAATWAPCGGTSAARSRSRASTFPRFPPRRSPTT
jgi:RNA polymerase sigma-70 factor (ECF subfamily)